MLQLHFLEDDADELLEPDAESDDPASVAAMDENEDDTDDEEDVSGTWL